LVYTCSTRSALSSGINDDFIGDKVVKKVRSFFEMNCSLDTVDQENYIVYNNVWKHNHVYNELENYFLGF
jgi:hypothetical protein